MEDDNFVWDDDKAARNWRDHAVTFEMARQVFATRSRSNGRIGAERPKNDTA